MKSKAGVTKDNVFSTLCRAGLDTKATGAKIKIQGDGFAVEHKQHKYYFVDHSLESWQILRQAFLSLQWYKSGKSPKRKR